MTGYPEFSEFSECSEDSENSDFHSSPINQSVKP